MKRYALAIVFLVLIVLLMLAATLGVNSFAENMFEDVKEVQMKPRGEKIEL